MSNRSDSVEGDGQRSERIHGIVNDCLLRGSGCQGQRVPDQPTIDRSAPKHSANRLDIVRLLMVSLACASGLYFRRKQC